MTTKLTSATVTDEMINALSIEAGEHGDDAMVEICTLALCGDKAARAACAVTINDARARAAEG